MNRPFHPALLAAPLLFVCATLFPSTVHCQEPDTVIVSIYRIAPGKHLDFLRWQAARDAVAKEIGLPETQWYAHMNGDSWDFVGIGPAASEEQDRQMDQRLQAQRLTTGFKAGLEFRTMVAWHTDTFARGPTSAAALVDAAK